jgi:hypothetical protein
MSIAGKERELEDKQPGRLIPVFLVILIVALGLPVLGLWLPDDVFKRLGSSTRAELIESGPNFSQSLEQRSGPLLCSGFYASVR